MRVRDNQDRVVCPPSKLLQEWLNGDIDLTETQISHIGECSRCTTTLAQLSDDLGLQKLADLSSARFSSDFLSEPELERVKEVLSRSLPNSIGTNQDSSSHLEGLRSTRTESEVTANNTKMPDWPSIDSMQMRLPASQFIVDRFLAHGGSGAVYLAYDTRLKREVAIKVLGRDSFRDRERFLREARILADLQHPNVVRVFDFGTLRGDHEGDAPERSEGFKGQLYLVMEYVSGGTLASYSSGNVDFRELAMLFATAADGIAAAHEKSLVHRDVKPGNLLFDKHQNSLKVADFGLARLVDLGDSQVTRTGEVLGTPVFMSPEQVASPEKVTAASDIYSLGATLYQVVTGVPPYQGGAAAVLRQVLESAPVAPRWINSSIPADLETICLHAMQPDPTARYLTMKDFAADLRRFASGEPIKAKPATSLRKAIRWVRKNRLLTAMLAICITLVCLLTVGSVIAASMYYQQARKLEVAVDSERASKQAAEESLNASITAADELLLAVTEETELLPRAPGSQQVNRKLLEKAKEYFQRFLETNRGNPTLKFQLARAHSGLATIAIRIGDRAAAEQETQASLDIIDTIPDDAISSEERTTLRSDTLIAQANYLIESGEPQLAIPLLEDAIQACDRAKGVSTPHSPKNLRSSRALATFGLANALHWVGKNEQATPLLMNVKEDLLKLNEESPGNHSYLRNAAACEMVLSTIALNQNQAAIGKEHLQSARDLLNRIPQEDAISLRIRELKVKVLTNLALADRRMGNNEDARLGYELAIAESQRLMELEPSVPSHRWNMVVASLNSGGPDLELGNHEALIARWQETLPVLDDLAKDEPDNNRYRQVKAMLQSNIAIVLRDIGRVEEAIAPLQAATATLLEQAKRVDYSPSDYLPVAVNHAELASTWIQMKQYEDATKELDASDGIVSEILERNSTFAPARAHWVDTLHARFEVLNRQGSSTLRERMEIAERAVDLAADLARNHGDIADYEFKWFRAMVDQARGFLESKDYTKAMELTHEVQRLSKAQEEDPKHASPDMRMLLARALLVEANALLESRSHSEERDALIRKQVAEAKLLGANEDDVSAILSQLN